MSFNIIRILNALATLIKSNQLIVGYCNHAGKQFLVYLFRNRSNWTKLSRRMGACKILAGVSPAVLGKWAENFYFVLVRVHHASF